MKQKQGRCRALQRPLFPEASAGDGWGNTIPEGPGENFVVKSPTIVELLYLPCGWQLPSTYWGYCTSEPVDFFPHWREALWVSPAKRIVKVVGMHQEHLANCWMLQCLAEPPSFTSYTPWITAPNPCSEWHRHIHVAQIFFLQLWSLSWAELIHPTICLITTLMSNRHLKPIKSSWLDASSKPATLWW